MFLRAEVDRVHEILEEEPSTSSNVKECLNCAKMQESQKNLGILIESQNAHKGKAGLGYCLSIEKAKGKGIVEELKVIEKKKSSSQIKDVQKKNIQQKFQQKIRMQRFNGYCLKCNTYGHKASNCRVIKKIEGISTNNRFAVLENKEVECFRCGMIGHIARKCMEDISIECFKCRKLGHYAWNCMQQNWIECYRCHIFGHIARDYKTIFPSQKI